ncbi:MAG: hypothetical protein WCR46_10415 [Deltaproteobacteria bacterium]
MTEELPVLTTSVSGNIESVPPYVGSPYPTMKGYLETGDITGTERYRWSV